MRNLLGDPDARASGGAQRPAGADAGRTIDRGRFKPGDRVFIVSAGLTRSNEAFAHVRAYYFHHWDEVETPTDAGGASVWNVRAAVVTLRKGEGQFLNMDPHTLCRTLDEARQVLRTSCGAYVLQLNEQAVAARVAADTIAADLAFVVERAEREADRMGADFRRDDV